MLKKLFLSIFLVLSLNANDALNIKIKNIIGSLEYQTHKNLIKFIFKKENQYYVNEKFNYPEIIKTLQENGLLKLAFAKPKDIEINFKINSDPIKSLKILNDTLKSLGYYYYFTKHTRYDSDKNLIWTIKLKTEAAIDPLVLSNELLNHDCRILEINKGENDTWSYDLDTSNSTISEAVYISANERVTFKKPLKPYFIKIDKATSIYITSRILNNWFPYVVFYDRHLNILKVSKDDKMYSNITLAIPENTRYIKITDLYTLFNIKRGLSILIKE